MSNVNSPYAFSTVWKDHGGGVWGSAPATSSITVNGSGFGATGPTVVFFRDWTNGTEGVDLPLTPLANEIGTFDSGNTFFPFNQSKFFPAYGSGGASLREGGTTTETNDRAGFTATITAFREYFIAYDHCVPSGRTFSGAATENTFPALSSLKNAWIDFNDGYADANEPDIVAWTYPSQEAFAIGGNSAESNIGIGDAFDFGVWNSCHTWQKPGANPTVNNGETRWRVTRGGADTHLGSRTDQPMFKAGLNNDQYETIRFPGWSGNGDQSNSQHLYKNYYFAVGDNASASLLIGNNATLTLCDDVAVIVPSSWSDIQVVGTPTANQLSGKTHYFVMRDNAIIQSGAL